jgi:hypothetical protein
MGAIIWQKVTTTNTTGGASIMGSFPYPRSGILKIDYEFILLFKKQGKPPIPEPKAKKQSVISTKEWNEYFSGHWNFAGTRQDGHIAMFPEELPARLIKMFSFVGDTVLDPFWGSGTTSLSARNLNRNSIGYEINPEFIEIGKQKLSTNELNLFEVNYEFPTDDCFRNHDDDILKLPYIFNDPHKLNKLIDIKKLQFGSKIDGEKKDREKYFIVKDVLGPTTLLLNNDLKIRLIGVKENEYVNGQATRFLAEKTKGQKVFLKYDAVKHDGEFLLCYLYLKNKTFINAHLIKNGLASADADKDYRFREKFLSIVLHMQKGC